MDRVLDRWTHSVSFNHCDNPCCLVAQSCPGSGKNKTKQNKKKQPPVSAGESGDLGSIPGPGSSPGGANATPLQYSCLENSMDWGAWRAMVHRSQRVGQRDLRATGIFKIFNHQKGTGNDHLEELVPEKLGRQRQLGGALRKPEAGTFIFNFKKV